LNLIASSCYFSIGSAKRLFIQFLSIHHIASENISLETGRKRDNNMLVLENKLNTFEKELEEHRMHINNITMSSIIDGRHDEYALYCIVQYGRLGR
jgi:hypothetical protein